MRNDRGQDHGACGEGASDQLTLAVLDAIPAHLAVLDETGCIVTVNRGWRRFARENGASDALREGVGVDYLAACRQADGDALEDGRLAADGIGGVLAREYPIFTMEYPCHAPGHERWFLMTASPLDGAVRGALVTHRDITERRRAETEARKAREVLTQMARIHSLGIIASSLVHELTQPLAAMGFFSEAAITLLEEGREDPELLAEALHGIDAQVTRLGEVLRSLREHSRGGEVRLTPVAIDQVIARAIKLIAWLAAERQVRLRYVPAATKTEVAADPTQIETVLVNLLCNSIQAITAGRCKRREVSIRVEPRAHEVEVIVRDTGPGLPPERVEAVFDLFLSTKSQGTAMGMGLPICRGIIEAHGGRLWADAQAKHGAVFRFTLPRETGGGSA
jgi:C4-dicarboxylate-specific signal transduction histidine kinase